MKTNALRVSLFLLALGFFCLFGGEGISADKTRIQHNGSSLPISSLNVHGSIYKNNKYSYEVKYPQGWNVIEAKPRQVYKPGNAINILIGEEVQKVTFLENKYANWQGKFRIKVMANPDKLSFEQWINRNEYKHASGDSSVKGISAITMNGKAAKKLSIFGFDHEEIEIIIFYKKYIYNLNFTGKNPNDTEFERHQQIYKEIESTFKFIE